jgi:hypothetical protein
VGQWKDEEIFWVQTLPVCLASSPHVPLQISFYSNNKSLVNEVTTLRRHLEASHSVSLLANTSVSCLDSRYFI